MQYGPRAQLALDTILGKPVKGIPSWNLFTMQHDHIERIAGVQPGDYVKRPEEVYVKMQQAAGTCMIDQYIPTNPLSMGGKGYEGGAYGATTGAKQIVCDGMVIDSPEAVVGHMERFVFPSLEQQKSTVDESRVINRMISDQSETQAKLGPDILKTPYGGFGFPRFRYGEYGYEYYFMAYALYQEVIEKDFSLQADLAVLINRAVVKAYDQGCLPPFSRLDSDMADGRGTLVNVKSLDEIWFPQFARSLEPLLKTDVKLIWHCDGNLWEMVPRLLEVGIRGFQGFQYEFGMDYEKICAMRTRDGEELLIIGGVSVTRTLPMGTPDDIIQELAWLVEKGPKVGLFLGVSSSITPGVPWENMHTLVEGLKYYQEHGRQ